METIQAEVRLYYNGRQDWDTEYFQATCVTDLVNKAEEIANNKRPKPDHFTFGRATAVDTDDKPKNIGRKLKGLGPSAKDHVKAIQNALGINTEDE